MTPQLKAPTTCFWPLFLALPLAVVLGVAARRPDKDKMPHHKYTCCCQEKK
jgi:hypothetical protein